MSIKKQRRCGLCNLWPEACECGQPCKCIEAHGLVRVRCPCDLTCPDPACKMTSEVAAVVERDCIKCSAAFTSREPSQRYCKRCALNHGEGADGDDITDADKKTIKRNFDKFMAQRNMTYNWAYAREESKRTPPKR